MDSESDNISSTKNINLTLTVIDVNDLELNWENFKDECEKENVKALFQKIKGEDDPNLRMETLNEVNRRSIINLNTGNVPN